MKKIILSIFILLALVSYSCEENISSKAPFKEDYIIYCVINTDTTLQTAYITSSYSVEGYDPAENKTDPALEGAVVKVTVNGQEEYVFNEAVAPRNDTSRYKTPFKYYVADNFHAMGGSKIDIIATLQNGKVLKSSTTAPYIENLFYETNTQSYDPSLNDAQHPGIAFAWKFLGGYVMNLVVNYFVPRLDIVYSTTDNPDKKIRVKVPRFFNKNGGSLIPVYPVVFTGTNTLFYQESIDEILNSISRGDSQKSRYIIHEAEFTLLLMDKSVAGYVAAENTFNDEFSIRIDAADFNNIQGGIGMFGTYAAKKTKIKIAKWYIQSLGYTASY